MNLDDFADPVLADAAGELLCLLERLGMVAARVVPGPDGTVIITEVDLGEVAEMDVDGAVEIVLRRPTVREPAAWLAIHGRRCDPPVPYRGEAWPRDLPGHSRDIRLQRRNRMSDRLPAGMTG
jgi:hypothetical protein